MVARLRVTYLFFVILIAMLGSRSFAYDSNFKSGSDLGLTASYYKYQEPKVMNIKAINLGASYTGTLASDNGWFLSGDLIGAISINAKYSSDKTGTMSEKNWYIDPRALLGKNFAFESSALVPYVGCGYRYLYNDGRGVSSTRHSGYRRASNYFYLPTGITHKMNLTESSELVTNIEFDALIIGKQRSYLSDTRLYSGDLNNTQKSGYGLRLSSMLKFQDISIGPYLIYWNIKDSDAIYMDGIAKKDSGLFHEPPNNTLEAGLKISFHF